MNISSNKIEFSEEDRKHFSQAIKELISQVDGVKQNRKNQHNNISSEGTTTKYIHKSLSFLKKYGFRYKATIKRRGVLGKNCDIIFAPQKILQDNLVNTLKLTPKKGVYIYFSYSGYSTNDESFDLLFGFPNGGKDTRHVDYDEDRHGNHNNAMCPAVQTMIEENALEQYSYSYQSLDIEKICNDFQEMMNYFLKFNPNDFNQSSNSAIQSNQPLNQILYGPPGTGKTYHMIDRALEILGEYHEDQSREERKKIFDNYRQQGQIKFITFHQSYGYEEFVEGIKPITENGNVTYEVQDGIFKKICERASQNDSKPYILIIDEINRGNVSKIFGELITLIEPSKRIGADEELRVTLPYSQELFGVPKNLYIIGTMNTADRSITALDTALRRRFEFVEMMPDATKLGKLEVNDKEINLQSMLEAINQRIEFLLDREKTIGHAYFLEIDSLDKLKEVFQNKIIPLLQEYFYNDYEAIQAVLNKNGMVEIKVDSNKQEETDYIFKGAFKDFINNRGLDEKKVFEIAPKDKDIWDKSKTYTDIYEENKKNQSDNNKQNPTSSPDE